MNQMATTEEIADRIRAARKERGWSQARLAEEAGVAPNTVLAIEGAKGTPQASKLRAVLHALGLNTLDRDRPTFRVTVIRTLTDTYEVEADSALAANEEWQRVYKPTLTDVPGAVVTDLRIERIGTRRLEP